MKMRLPSQATETLAVSDQTIERLLAAGVLEPDDLVELFCREMGLTSSPDEALTDNPFVGQKPNHDDLLARAVRGPAEQQTINSKQEK